MTVVSGIVTTLAAVPPTSLRKVSVVKWIAASPTWSMASARTTCKPSDSIFLMILSVDLYRCSPTFDTSSTKPRVKATVFCPAADL